MEVQGQQPLRPHPSIQRFEEAQAELVRANRDRVRQAREALTGLVGKQFQAARAARREAEARRIDDSAQIAHASERQESDRVDLSAAARTLAENASPERDAAVQELKAQRDAGTLDTPARIELAAQRMLGA